MFLNMFENPVSIEVAFNQFLFYSDNGKRHFKSSPRTFWTDLVCECLCQVSLGLKEHVMGSLVVKLNKGLILP